ncbi:MAG: hypothetical protein ABI867_12010 [Kofleriaceae bacterium]
MPATPRCGCIASTGRRPRSTAGSAPRTRSSCRSCGTDAQFSQLLLGGDPSAKPLAVAMQVAWSAFIHGGEPAAPGLPAWPTYAGERRATMLLDRTPSVVDDPAGTLRALYP